MATMMMTIPTTPPTTATPGIWFHGIGADEARLVSTLDTVPSAAYAVQWVRDKCGRYRDRQDRPPWTVTSPLYS
jgi:predicted esterase